jgi:hypothetical protein
MKVFHVSCCLSSWNSVFRSFFPNITPWEPRGKNIELIVSCLTSRIKYFCIFTTRTSSTNTKNYRETRGVYGDIGLINIDCQSIESWRGTNKKVLSGYYGYSCCNISKYRSIMRSKHSTLPSRSPLRSLIRHFVV